MLVTLGITVGFGKSDNLTSAYGIAVSATMLMTSVLLFIAMREIWGWSLVTAGIAGHLLVCQMSSKREPLRCAVDHLGHPLHPRLVADCSARAEEDRPDVVLDQLPFDLPYQPPPLLSERNRRVRVILIAAISAPLTGAGEWLPSHRCFLVMDRASHYRGLADHARQLAEATWQEDLADMLRRVAREFEETAEEIEAGATEGGL